MLHHTLSVVSLKLDASSRPLAAPPSGPAKCLRFGHWLTLCTLNISLLTYLLTYLLWMQVFGCCRRCTRCLQCSAGLATSTFVTKRSARSSGKLRIRTQSLSLALESSYRSVSWFSPIFASSTRHAAVYHIMCLSNLPFNRRYNAITPLTLICCK